MHSSRYKKPLETSSKTSSLRSAIFPLLLAWNFSESPPSSTFLTASLIDTQPSCCAVKLRVENPSLRLSCLRPG